MITAGNNGLVYRVVATEYGVPHHFVDLKMPIPTTVDERWYIELIREAYKQMTGNWHPSEEDLRIKIQESRGREDHIQTRRADVIARVPEVETRKSGNFPVHSDLSPATYMPHFGEKFEERIRVLFWLYDQMP